MTPKITVVTVVRNAAALIDRTILSVLAQDYPNVEYIIVDGASTDGTLAKIQSYAETVTLADGRSLRYVSEPDGGIYDAMNKALRMATGEWVNFMNAGDTFANDHVLTDVFGDDGALAKHCNTADEKQQPWVIGGNTVNFFADGREEIHHAEAADVIPQRMPFSHQAAFVRIQPETFCFGMQYPFAADYKLLYDLYFAYGASAFLILDLPIARYRQEDSLSMNPQNQRAIKSEYLRIQSAHRSWHWWKEYLKLRLM